jgi:hypothetical protein
MDALLLALAPALKFLLYAVAAYLLAGLGIVAIVLISVVVVFCFVGRDAL